MNSLKFAFRYLNHCVCARNTKGYGVHSPSMFHFIRYVLTEKYPYYAFRDIEKIRMQLLSNKGVIGVTDLGTGKDRNEQVNQIARKSLKNAKQAQLLFRIIQHFGFVNILELGTSLGVTTMYMASSNSKINCTTLEGCPEISKIAKKNFQKLGLTQIRLFNCNIDEKLDLILNDIGRQDLIFIDANHSYEPLINYFETCLRYIGDNSIIVIDDIYWSDGMLKAWKYIKNHPKVSCTIDLFYMGIVFFNPIFTGKNYKVRI